MRTVMTEPGVSAQFCGQCGRSLDEAVHDGCGVRARLEPPRYCTVCARRMIVQVMPTGWAARCSRHGALASPN